MVTYLVKMVRRGYCSYSYHINNDTKIYFEMEFDEEITDKYAFYRKMKEQYPDLILISCEKLFKELSNGWKKLEGTLTAPKGYYWASNGKSFFDGTYERALIKIC